jgi:uncharacterized protein (DUF1810 family)
VTHDLDRFISAQDGVVDGALAELRRGRKTGHWMWFIFPQVGGLGHSHMARTYAIDSLAEAQAYAAHPVLGERLRACAGALLGPHQLSAEEILGPVDARKLRSSMTLFHRAVPEEAVFRQVLDRYFDGVCDPATDERLA